MPKLDSESKRITQFSNTTGHYDSIAIGLEGVTEKGSARTLTGLTCRPRMYGIAPCFSRLTSMRLSIGRKYCCRGHAKEHGALRSYLDTHHSSFWQASFKGGNGSGCAVR